MDEGETLRDEVVVHNEDKEPKLATTTSVVVPLAVKDFCALFINDHSPHSLKRSTPPSAPFALTSLSRRDLI